MKRLSLVFARSIAALLLAGASIFGVSAPALAHDDEVSTLPTEGSVNEAGILQLSVMFAESIMTTDNNDGIAFEVLDPAGKAILTGEDACLMVHDSMMMSQVEVVDPGTYTVNWRSVASDGHPVSGNYRFDVTNDNGYTATGANCLMTAEVGAEPLASGTMDDHNVADAATDDSGIWGLVTGVVLLIGISLAGYFVVERKNKAAREKKKYE